ncbi:MAG: M48 family metallopeptidase, partial [Caulobacteraceae bacterium]
MRAVGLQTYIWNNNIRSGLLLAGFPLLLVGMVFVLALGMIWGGLLPSSGTPAGDLAYAWRLLAAPAPAAIVVTLIWFAIAYFFNQAIVDVAKGASKVARADEP